jgi:hypothetical protein
MMILCLTLQDWANIATIGGFVIAVIGVYYALYQLKQIKETNYATGFVKAGDILQDENTRDARKYVIENLSDKSLASWGKGKIK